MNRKAGAPCKGSDTGQVTVLEADDDSPDLVDLSFDELRHRFDTSAAAARRNIPSNPATHGSAIRQVVSGKVFKKCKSATFQIDGATYTIGKLHFEFFLFQCTPPGHSGSEVVNAHA